MGKLEMMEDKIDWYESFVERKRFLEIQENSSNSCLGELLTIIELIIPRSDKQDATKELVKRQLWRLNGMISQYFDDYIQNVSIEELQRFKNDKNS